MLYLPIILKKQRNYVALMCVITFSMFRTKNLNQMSQILYI